MKDKIKESMRKKLIGKTFSRHVQIDSNMIDLENRTVELPFSSETPVRQWFGMEILDHDQMDLEFLDSGYAPFLKDHDPTIQTGIVQRATIDSDRRGRAVIRFAKNAIAESEYQDMLDGIRVNVSVRYDITEVLDVEEGEEGELPTYRFASRPFEISMVSIPADESVGLGRSKEFDDITNKNEGKKMDPENTNEGAVDTASRSVPQVETQAVAPDFKAAETSAREKEVNRIREIEAYGEQHGVKEMAREAISKGTSVAAFRGQLLETIANKPAKLPDATVDMSPKEQRQYSILKAIDALERNDWREAGLERECSRELETKYGKNARGLFIPTNISWSQPSFQAQRDLTVASTNGGSKLKGTDQRGDLFIDALRAEMILSQLGVSVITGLQGDVDIPSLSTKTTVAFMSNETTAVTEGAPQFSQKQLAPKTCSGWVDISRKLMIQSDPSVEAIVRNDIIQQIASKIEDVAFEGGGTGEPSGLINCTNINVVALGTNGAAPTYASTVDCIQQVAIDNALRGNLAYASSPQAWYKLATTAKVASTDSKMILDPTMNNLNGFPYYMSTNIPSDLTKGSGSSLSALFFGNWRDLLLAFWSGVDLVVDKSSLSTIGATRVVFFQDVDVTCRHDESFSVIKDMVTT